MLLSWNVQHADVNGTLYEVRIFDDIQSPSQTRLTYLKQVSAHFSARQLRLRPQRWQAAGSFRFKTIAAIRAELKKMGVLKRKCQMACKPGSVLLAKG